MNLLRHRSRTRASINTERKQQDHDGHGSTVVEKQNKDRQRKCHGGFDTFIKKTKKILSTRGSSRKVSSRKTGPNDCVPFWQSKCMHRAWARVRKIDQYEERLGLEIMEIMMDADVTSKEEFSTILPGSSRSLRLSQTFVEIVSFIILSYKNTSHDRNVNYNSSETDNSCTDVTDNNICTDVSDWIHEQCQRQGIQTFLLGRSISEAIQILLGSDKFDNDMKHDWRCAIDDMIVSFVQL